MAHDGHLSIMFAKVYGRIDVIENVIVHGHHVVAMAPQVDHAGTDARLGDPPGQAQLLFFTSPVAVHDDGAAEGVARRHQDAGDDKTITADHRPLGCDRITLQQYTYL